MENRGHFHPRLPFSSDDQSRGGTFAGVSTLTTTATMMFSANANRVVKVMEGYPKEPDIGNDEQPAGPPSQKTIAFQCWGRSEPASYQRDDISP
ncbi:hypothetical protein [Rhizobium sp. LjRoot258]|uniref:hypothetical protein n=1 Tax=Rhizobium sp. LjRoot258 TaxID=3342299 RepID=UPI003ECE249F